MLQRLLQTQLPSPTLERFRVGGAQASSTWVPSVFQKPDQYDSLDSQAPVLGKMNSLETRLARSHDEVIAAQSLRYKVFFKELAAKPNTMNLLTRRDKDLFDQYCDHLLVFDRKSDIAPEVVATYRLLRQETASRVGGFYTGREFDLAPLLARYGHLEFLELGRSCILPTYRNKRTVELLWQGAWSYILKHNIDVLIGCASIQGTNLSELAMPLSYLHHHSRAPEIWRVSATGNQGCSMNQMEMHDIDEKKALRALPPLIKGYLRLGAWVGEEAVIDYQFGTTDVLIILPVANIKKRYVDFYGSKIL